MSIKENVENNYEEINDDVNKSDSALVVGYTIGEVLICLYFIVQGIKNNNFDYICLSFVCLPYSISEILIGIKERKVKKIILHTVIAIILLVSYILRLIGIGVK